MGTYEHSRKSSRAGAAAAMWEVCVDVVDMYTARTDVVNVAIALVARAVVHERWPWTLLATPPACCLGPGLLQRHPLLCSL